MLRRRIGTILKVALPVAVAAATARYIIWPKSDEPGRADAVVVLGGGGPERLAEARRLVEAGVAPTLVISRQPGSEEANRLCDEGAEFDVLWFVPKPNRTQGEARAAATLARRHGWDSVVVVTSDYHLTRARLIFRRCLDDVRAVGARPESPGGLPSFAHLVHEWVSYPHAALTARGC